MRLTVVRRTALLLTGLTGFSGLVYEVAWERLLATLLGSDSAATAAVLALFLGGLAIGYVGFGRLSLSGSSDGGRSRRLLVRYGLVELGIGLHAFAFVPLLEYARGLSLLLPAMPGPLAFAIDVGLAALVVQPGAVLMGGTIPFLTQALSRGPEDATRVHAQIYAINTLGAFAGGLTAAFWLIDGLGLAGVLSAMALLNGLVGIVFIAMGRNLEARSGVPIASAGPPRQHAPVFDAFAAIALLAGFAMMTLEAVVIRLGALALGASQFTFALVVAAFIVCLAAGSFGVASLSRVPAVLLPVCLWGMVAVLAALFAPLENVTWAAHALRAGFTDDPSQFLPFVFSVFAGLLLLLAPALLLSGATLPLLFHHVRREGVDLGARAGAIYGWNTLGSLLGALLGGYLLLYWMDLHHVYRLAVLALAGAAALASHRAQGLAVLRSAAAFAVVAALLAGLPGWSPDRMAAGVFREHGALPGTFDGPDAFYAANPRGTIRFHVDDPTATITVKEGSTRGGQLDRAIVTNGKSDGFMIGERKNTGLAGLVPALLVGRVERAFVIGYGTGVTAAELAALDETRTVVVAEISPGVIEAAPWFDWANGGASHNPEIRIEERDAYHVLLRSREPFDVIVSEPSNPWVSGVEMLYSVEFLRSARDALRPGGVHAQWFHLYDLDDATVALILRTYASVFPKVAVWFTNDSDLLLIGIRDDPRAALDIARLDARAGRPDFAAGLARSGVPSFPALLAHELLPLGVVHALELEGELHTLYHPRLGHAATLAFFAGSHGELPPRVSVAAMRTGAASSLVRRYAATFTDGLRERDRDAIARETCAYRPRECAAVLAEWRYSRPTSPIRDALFTEQRVPARIQGAEIPFVVDTLARLHDGAPFVESEDPLRTALDATRRFIRFYHYAAPFDPAAVAQAWDRCATSSDAQRCDALRCGAEPVLGALGPLVARR